MPPATGPYTIKKITPGRSIVYKYNPKYWGRDLAVTRGQFNIQELTYKYYRDDAIALEAFKAGDYDFRYESNASRWATQYNTPAIADGSIIREITSINVLQRVVHNRKQIGNHFDNLQKVI